MNFMEALNCMEQNHGVIRESWKNEDGTYDKYLVLMQGMQSVWQILLRPNVNAGNHLFTRDDYRANDWIPIN